MNYKTVLFDFDGVLCKERFYEKTLLPQYTNVYNWIQEYIFSDKELVWKWMRNQTTSDQINTHISQNTGIEYQLLNKLYKESIQRMELDKEVLDIAKSIKASGKKIGIVTDNMDVFSEITVSHHQLNTLFNSIINSAEYGILKKEENGKLFDYALSALNTDIKDTLLIDDSESTIEFFKQKGGEGIVYKNTLELKLFIGII